MRSRVLELRSSAWVAFSRSSNERWPLVRRLSGIARWRRTYLPIAMEPAKDVQIDAVVVSTHKFIGGPAASGIQAVGASLLYLPTYSPDFNPIEMAFPNSRRCRGALDARSLASNRQRYQPIHARRMPKLSRRRRIRCNVIGKCSSIQAPGWAIRTSLTAI